MRTRLTMRTALFLGLPSVARQIGRTSRSWHMLLRDAGHEAGRGNVVTATVLLGVYLAGL